MRNIITGLDIGSSAIRIAVVEVVSGSREPKVLAQVKKESRGLRRGYIINFDETLRNLSDAIAEAERQTKTRIRRVILGIGGITLESKIVEGQITVSKADLEISEPDLERALAVCKTNLGEMPNRHVLHNFPLSCKIDGKKVPGRPDGLRGSKLELRTVFVHCLSQHINDLVKVVEAAGLSIDDVVASPLASSTAVLTATQKAAGCTLANIGSQTTSLITYEDNQPIAIQVLPIGSNDITNDIALGLRLSLDEAERIKLDPMAAMPVKRKLDEIIEARVIDMFELIDGHLKKIGRSGLLPAGIIITGGGANILDLESLAKETLRLPAKIFNPLDDNRLRTQLRDQSWAVAYGLCLRGLETENEDSWNSKLRHAWQIFVKWFKDLWP
jgi:cell division protein FtsA